MYYAKTHQIEVSVRPVYMPERSEPELGHWFWAYTIEITNAGDRTVQLVARHWTITDANGKVEEVRGPGVVGEQPILTPGTRFSYTSGCPLTTSSGIMHGVFHMQNEDGEPFDVTIPVFSLDSPMSPRMLN